MKPRLVLTCAKSPCKSCPYRRDVPSGVWAAEEYEKLPLYDGDILEQALKGATARFDCHQRDGTLCAGWVAVHGGRNLLAMRILSFHNAVNPYVWDYVSPVPLWTSGAEACAHGKRSIQRPGRQARGMIDRLVRKRDRDKWSEE